MPVTVYPAHRPSEGLNINSNSARRQSYLDDVGARPIPVSSPEDLFHNSCLFESFLKASDSCPPLQSSFKNTFAGMEFDQSRVVLGASNGFVHACLKVYFDHHHLIIRPDNIWLAIITQLNFYVRKRANRFRSRFVEFPGLQILKISNGGECEQCEHRTSRSAS